MTSFFIAAATVLLLAMFPLAALALRGSLVAALVALEVAGILSTCALVCYSVGAQSTASTSLAVVTAMLTWVSGMIYVRLMEREP
jgi:multisubunit Na+/H+ antiporter MnhF subunit